MDFFLTMMNDFEYYAFISYQRNDEEWAKWLQKKLEYYKLPVQEENIQNQFIRPVFRDITDLTPGFLSQRINEALDNSKFLIAICSPNYRKSKWCNAEVQHFIDSGKLQNIIPFIVDGTPYSETDNCFPPALEDLHETAEELLGVDVRTLSREFAFVQVVARMLGVKVDSLWKRYLKDEEEAKRRLKEENDRLFALQSRIVAEKAKDLMESWPYDVNTAGKLAQEVLPSDIDFPERPWVPEAEYVLRKALATEIKNVKLPEHVFPLCYSDNFIVGRQNKDKVKFDENKHTLVTTSPTPDYSILLFDREGKLKKTFPFEKYSFVDACCISPDDGHFAFYSKGAIHLYNIVNDRISLSFDADFHPHHSPKQWIKWGPGGRYIAYPNDCAIEVFDLHSNRKFTLEGHSEKIFSLDFDPSGKYLITSSFDKNVIIWDLEKMDCHQTFLCDSLPSFATLSENNELIVSIDYNVGKSFENDINKQGRNVIRIYNLDNGSSTDVVLLDNSTYSISNIRLDKDAGCLTVETGAHGIIQFEYISGVPVMRYPDSHRLSLNKRDRLISMTKGNAVVTFNNFTKKELLKEAEKRFGAVNLSEDVKRQFFIK